jgi:glycine cleavage system H lipoate-binding protein
MRIQVISGDNPYEVTTNTNEWLKENEDSVVIISISPAIPRDRGGAYVTITYSKVESAFGKNLATNS